MSEATRYEIEMLAITLYHAHRGNDWANADELRPIYRRKALKLLAEGLPTLRDGLKGGWDTDYGF